MCKKLREACGKHPALTWFQKSFSVSRCDQKNQKVNGKNGNDYFSVSVLCFRNLNDDFRVSQGHHNVNIQGNPVSIYISLRYTWINPRTAKS